MRPIFGELSFRLPDGYRDGSGRLHRDGVLRAARAGDEVRALSDFRAHLHPRSFLLVILAKVVSRLGSLSSVDSGVIDRLTERDQAHLEGLYRKMNGYCLEDGG